jgi:hypothetical protein
MMMSPATASVYREPTLRSKCSDRRASPEGRSELYPKRRCRLEVWFTDDHMTNALEDEIEQAQKLPRVEQDLVGEMVLAYMEGDRRTYRLTPEQVAEVKLAQAEVGKGKIATDDEVQKR